VSDFWSFALAFGNEKLQSTTSLYLQVKYSAHTQSDMSHIEPQPHPAAGVYAPDKNDHAHEDAQINKTGAGTYVSSENETAVTTAAGNEVLEHDAHTKGRWFQYVKTKQFWITLLLGQGESSIILKSQIKSHLNWMISPDLRKSC
jgi:hypothetical protein